MVLADWFLVLGIVLTLIGVWLFRRVHSLNLSSHVLFQILRSFGISAFVFAMISGVDLPVPKGTEPRPPVWAWALVAGCLTLTAAAARGLWWPPKPADEFAASLESHDGKPAGDDGEA